VECCSLQAGHFWSSKSDFSEWRKLAEEMTRKEKYGEG